MYFLGSKVKLKFILTNIMLIVWDKWWNGAKEKLYSRK